MNESLITQKEWDRSYEGCDLAIAPEGDPIRDWLELHLPRGRGPAIELGCYPGRFLAVLGELGYELHGVDLTPQVSPQLRDWLQHCGYALGEFRREDVWSCNSGRKYQVVCSFGLIEHFENWAALLELHAAMVAEGGYIVVSTPNFRGLLQQGMHRWVDRKNLAGHNLAAMQPGLWRELLVKLGFEVVSCRYLGPFDFWVGVDAERTFIQKVAVRAVRSLIPVGRLLPDNVSVYAPYCGIIAKRGRIG